MSMPRMPQLDPRKPPHMEEAPSDLIPVEQLYDFYLEGYTAQQELNNKHRELLANAPTREAKDRIFRMLMEEKSATQQHAMNLSSRLGRSLQWHHQEAISVAARILATSDQVVISKMPSGSCFGLAVLTLLLIIQSGSSTEI